MFGERLIKEEIDCFEDELERKGHATATSPSLDDRVSDDL